MNRENIDTDSKNNLGLTERVISVLGGSYLLFNALKQEKTNYTSSAAAGYLMYRGATGNCPLYGAVISDNKDMTGHSIHIRTGLTINKPRGEVYSFWRKLENLPLFMDHLESVNELDENRSEWKAKIPGDMGTLSWKSEIVSEEKDKLIQWQSLPGSTIENAGRINFRDAGKLGTEIHVEITYRSPLGTPGEGVLQLLNPVFEKMVKRDIKNFKKYMETGEVPVSGMDRS